MGLIWFITRILPSIATRFHLPLVTRPIHAALFSVTKLRYFIAGRVSARSWSINGVGAVSKNALGPWLFNLNNPITRRGRINNLKLGPLVELNIVPCNTIPREHMASPRSIFHQEQRPSIPRIPFNPARITIPNTNSRVRKWSVRNWNYQKRIAPRRCPCFKCLAPFYESSTSKFLKLFCLIQREIDITGFVRRNSSFEIREQAYILRYDSSRVQF